MDIVTAAMALADTSELGLTAALMCGRCRATGLVAASYRCLMGAARVLDNPYMPMLHRGVRWRTDVGFVNRLIDLECDIYNRLVQVNATIARIQQMIAELWATYDETPETEYCLVQIGLLQGALEALHPAAARLRYALYRVAAAPSELGEVYAAAYRHVRAGRLLPHRGRWLTSRGAQSLLHLPR